MKKFFILCLTCIFCLSFVSMGQAKRMAKGKLGDNRGPERAKKTPNTITFSFHENLPAPKVCRAGLTPKVCDVHYTKYIYGVLKADNQAEFELSPFGRVVESNEVDPESRSAVFDLENLSQAQNPQLEQITTTGGAQLPNMNF